MAFREATMWEILEVLRRHQRGESQRTIQAATGKARKTIRRYVRAARGFGWDPSSRDPDEELARRVLRAVQPGPKEPQRGESFQALHQVRDQVRTWIEEEQLQVTKVLDLLERREIRVPYRTLHRFVVETCSGYSRKGTTVRMDESAISPGEIAEVDFGRLGLVPDPDHPGKNCLVQALVVTLVYSRHQYVAVTRGQKLPQLVAALEDAWEFFGGVTELVVLDNLKAAVAKADRYAPVFNRTFEEYAAYRGFHIDATRSRKAKDKAKVERQVPFVRKNFFRGESWLNPEHVQREARQWCLGRAGLRTHGTTRRQPLVVFREEEKSALQPLERERYDPPTWKTCKVHADCHIRTDYALYSVPWKHHGKQVDVRIDSKTVRIYLEGEQIKIHARVPPGAKQTDFGDYPDELTPYTTREPEARKARAAEVGPAVQRFVEELLAPPTPWKNLRQADMLLGQLRKKFGDERLETACQRALYFHRINAYAVKRILEEALASEPAGQNTLFAPLPPSRFAREAGEFRHASDDRKELN